MLTSGMKAIGMLAAAALALAAPAASAAPRQGSLDTYTSKGVSGYQFVVSCLSAKLCVLGGYNGKGVGDIVPVRNGTPQAAVTFKGTSAVYGVSCPNPSGCVALARTSNDVGAVFAAIGKSGKVTKSAKVSLPPLVSLQHLSCTRLTSCEVVGLDDTGFARYAIEVGSWNGKKLTLHKTKVYKGDVTVTDIACIGTSCDVAGYILGSNSKDTGFDLTVSHGSIGKLHTAADDALYGISCVSASRCYADGFSTGPSGEGLVVTANNGTIGSPHSVSGDLAGIACAGSSCTAVGSAGSTEGEIGGVSSGVPGTPDVFPGIGPVNGVAVIGGMFFAIGSSGPGSHLPSELTYGNAF